ncbi:MAG: hypothetical protein JW807_11785 [Spirochaetes bacterium]|nr:hypothetical protein [Spirochaetota bacterium]
MAHSDIDVLLDQIRDTIKARSDGLLSLEKTRDAYNKLLSRYRKLEKKYISEQTGAFLKGLLFQHNRLNGANLTAIFHLENNVPVPLAFAGDRILLAAAPELIARELPSLKDDAASRVKLGEATGQTFSLALKKIEVGRDTIVVVAVTSTTAFDLGDFEYLAELLKIVYTKNFEFFSPVMLNYMNDISAEISRIFNTGKDGPIHADHFHLYSPPGTFTHAGIYSLIEFSNFVVSTLKNTYPASAHIFALSLVTFLVLYDEKTSQGLAIKQNKIDFHYHGNNIPYKVLHSVIDSPQSLYLFIEKL